MALFKNKISERGIITNYHRFSKVSLQDGILSATLESYPSAEYRQTAEPAEIENYNFSITVQEEESMGIRALCYTKLKTYSQWNDAEDC